MDKLKVVQVLDSFYPNVDGVVNTVDNYASLLSKNNNCKVIIPNYPDYHLEKPYEIVKSKSVKFKKNKYRLPLLIFERHNKVELTNFDADIIHAHSPFVLGHYALVAAKLKKIPIVTTFHSKYYDDFMENTKSKVVSKILMNYIIDFYKRVDEVWACSESTAKTLRSYGFKGPIRVMENGTNYLYPENYKALIEEAQRKFNIIPNKNTILFVGAFIWQKNIKLILNTIKELLNRQFDFQMIMVGAGNNEKDILKYAKELRIDENIIFTGKILDQDIMKGIYLQSDLFFFPSVYDNAPLVLREASAMKVPSLLTKGSNAAEVIEDDVNGFICEEDYNKMASKIIDLFSDKQKMKTVGEQASKTIPVSWDKIIERVENRYFEIIKNYNK